MSDIPTRDELFELDRKRLEKCETEKIAYFTSFILSYLKSMNSKDINNLYSIPLFLNRKAFNGIIYHDNGNCSYDLKDPEIFAVLEKETRKYGYDLINYDTSLHLAISEESIKRSQSMRAERNLETCQKYFSKFLIKPKLDNEFKQISYDSSMCDIKPFISSMNRNFPNYNFAGKIIAKDLFELISISKDNSNISVKY